MPDNDLLSHGQMPHYHRRWTVSLLSSEWIQVVHVRHDHQAKLVDLITEAVAGSECAELAMTTSL